MTQSSSPCTKAVQVCKRLSNDATNEQILDLGHFHVFFSFSLLCNWLVIDVQPSPSAWVCSARSWNACKCQMNMLVKRSTFSVWQTCPNKRNYSGHLLDCTAWMVVLGSSVLPQGTNQPSTKRRRGIHKEVQTAIPLTWWTVYDVTSGPQIGQQCSSYWPAWKVLKTKQQTRMEHSTQTAILQFHCLRQTFNSPGGPFSGCAVNKHRSERDTATWERLSLLPLTSDCAWTAIPNPWGRRKRERAASVKQSNIQQECSGSCFCEESGCSHVHWFLNLLYLVDMLKLSPEKNRKYIIDFAIIVQIKCTAIKGTICNLNNQKAFDVCLKAFLLHNLYWRYNQVWCRLVDLNKDDWIIESACIVQRLSREYLSGAVPVCFGVHTLNAMGSVSNWGKSLALS